MIRPLHFILNNKSMAHSITNNKAFQLSANSMLRGLLQKAAL